MLLHPHSLTNNGAMGKVFLAPRSLYRAEILPFLCPTALRAGTCTIQTSSFSTTPANQLRTRDHNKNRAVSGLRRTGPRYPLSVSKEALPQPILDPARRSKVQVNENHGLWGFFGKDRKGLSTPEEMAAHGTSIVHSPLLMRKLTI